MSLIPSPDPSREREGRSQRPLPRAGGEESAREGRSLSGRGGQRHSTRTTARPVPDARPTSRSKKRSYLVSPTISPVGSHTYSTSAPSGTGPESVDGTSSQTPPSIDQYAHV